MLITTIPSKEERGSIEVYTSLSELSALELAALIKQRKLSSVELMNHCIDRTHRPQTILNCLITICSDLDIEEARLLEAGVILLGKTIKGRSFATKHRITGRSKACLSIAA